MGPESGDERSKVQHLIFLICIRIAEFLLNKNRKYGNSAIRPKRFFSKSDPIEQINVRLDDKLSRLASNQADEDEDVEKDFIGYLVLKFVAKIIVGKATMENILYGTYDYRFNTFCPNCGTVETPEMQYSKNCRSCGGDACIRTWLVADDAAAFKNLKVVDTRYPIP